MAGGAGSSNGTGGMLTKLKAATLATESGVPVYICSSLKSDALIEAAEEQAGWQLLPCRGQGLKNPEAMASLLCRKAKVLFGWMLEQRKPCWIMERVY